MPSKYSDDELETIKIQTIRDAYDGNGLIIFLGIFSVILVINLLPYTRTLPFILWQLWLILTSGVRAILLPLFHKRERQDCEIPRWGHIYILVHAVQTLSVGIGYLFLLGSENSVYNAVAVGGLYGYVAAVAFVNMSFVQTTQVALFSMLLPIIIYSFLSVDPATRSIGLLSLIYLLSIFAYSKNSNATARKLILYRRDIERENTLRKESEDKLIALNEQFKQSLEKAESAVVAKQQFLANMSHEIRTPMNVISGMTYLLLKTELNTDQEKQLQNIHAASAGLSTIVDDILDFSKIESGKVKLETIPFSVSALLQDTVSFMEIRAEEKLISLKLSIAENIPAATVGDPYRIRQILINLINNAITFTSIGEVAVEARIEKQEGDLFFTTISITDTGVGIAEKKLANLFETFTQADSSTTRKYGGTGLGLSISKNLTELMNGSISVKSTPDVGSCFSVTIPLQKTSEENLPQESGMLTLPNLTDKKILIVDDHPLNQEILDTILRELHAKTTLATNGIEALAQIEQETFDIILMDIQMPEMDGIEAMTLITEKYPAFETPVIALTAHTLKDDVQEVKRVGFSSHIGKPLDPAVLYSTLRDFIPGLTEEKQEHTVIGTTFTIEGLNCLEAVTRVNSNWVTYKKLVVNYYDSLQNLNETIEKSIKEDNRDQLDQSLHTLKGVSDLIGAYQLVSRIVQLQKTEKSGENITRAAEEYHSTAEHLLHNLKSFVENRDAENESTSTLTTGADLYSQLVTLAKEIENREFKASHSFEKLKESLTSITPEKCKRLSEALTLFKFEQAESVINSILEESFPGQGV